MARTNSSTVNNSKNGSSSRSKNNNAPNIDAYEFEETQFEIDPELFNDEYNQTRRPILPYAIIVNDKPAGILIPTEQLEKAGWSNIPEENELTTVTLTEDVTGLLITEARLLVLGFAPEYIRYKTDEKLNELSGSYAGLYDDCKHNLDKKKMDVCSEHALIFLDGHNQPLHTTPIIVRFKNVALWSFKSVREEFYRSLEKSFAEYFQKPFKGKSDKWRSLGILEVRFKAIKEGTGRNQHYCCKTVSYTKATIKNLPKLYLGTSSTKALIWEQHNVIAGFNEPQSLPALPGESLIVEVIPPTTKDKDKKSKISKSQPPRKIQQIEDDDDFIDGTANEFDDDEEFVDEEELDDDE
jgi:hypothetical protein